MQEKSTTLSPNKVATHPPVSDISKIPKKQYQLSGIPQGKLYRCLSFPEIPEIVEVKYRYFGAPFPDKYRQYFR